MIYSEQVRKDAKAAADYIREHGWCQFVVEDKNGCVCALGATGALGLRWERELELDNALRNQIQSVAVGVWNDTPGRTKEEVLEVFDRIANSDKP